MLQKAMTTLEIFQKCCVKKGANGHQDTQEEKSVCEMLMFLASEIYKRK